MDVFSILVMAVDSQGFACVTTHPVTHSKPIVHQLCLIRLFLKITWKDPVKTHPVARFEYVQFIVYQSINKVVSKRIEKWIHYLVFRFSIRETFHGWGDGGSRVQPSSVIRGHMGPIVSIPATCGASCVMPGWASIQLSSQIWSGGQKWPAQVPYFYRW